ncbi:MAG: hypothetical protein CBC13_01725 [Planctomycetia bacterium TMED53]|nr:MAG: hypothetical protein CBC13_01725 [Planctomycetia bacterium TMED53]
MVSPQRSTSLRREEVTLLVSELSSVLEGQRVGKIFDAPHGNLRIVIGSGSRKQHLLISVHPGTSRMVLQEESSDAPPTPGEMVARLRSLLSGARIDKVDQPGGDRLMRLRLTFGSQGRHRRDLLLELFGRQGRLLVLEGKPARVRFVTGRGGLGTGEPYQYPEAPVNADSQISGGVSPTLPFDPAQLIPIELRQGETPFHHWLGPQLAQREERQILEGKLRQGQQELNRQRKVLRRRLENLERDLQTSLDWELWQNRGELLKSVLHQLKRGMSVVEVEDWYQPDSPKVELELIPEKTPIQNIERYFHKARKGKRSIDQLTERTENTREQCQTLDAFNAEGEALAQEDPLSEEAILEWVDRVERWSRAHGKKRQKPRDPQARRGRISKSKQESKPFLRYRSREGLEILVGRSARENDDLSIRTARGNDLFFHIAGKPGAHVILKVPRGKVAAPESIDDAAYIAAYRSGWRGPGGVAVHWTEAKFVRKPKGLPPGKVLVDREREHWVTPREEGLAPLIPVDKGES